MCNTHTPNNKQKKPLKNKGKRQAGGQKPVTTGVTGATPDTPVVPLALRPSTTYGGGHIASIPPSLPPHPYQCAHG